MKVCVWYQSKYVYSGQEWSLQPSQSLVTCACYRYGTGLMSRWEPGPLTLGSECKHVDHWATGFTSLYLGHIKSDKPKTFNINHKLPCLAKWTLSSPFDPSNTSDSSNLSNLTCLTHLILLGPLTYMTNKTHLTNLNHPTHKTHLTLTFTFSTTT